MDIRYFAGLFDGEGMIRIARWQKPNSPHVRYALYASIGMTHRPIIEAWCERFCGTLNMNRHDKRNAKHRIQFTWSAGSQVAASAMRELEPHLIVKRDEVQIALKLQQHIDDNPYVPLGRGKGRALTDEQLAYRESLYQQITSLKKRRYPPLTD